MSDVSISGVDVSTSVDRSGFPRPLWRATAALGGGIGGGLLFALLAMRDDAIAIEREPAAEPVRDQD